MRCGHDSIGDSTKLRRLAEPLKSSSASSGGDSLTTSFENASRSDAVFWILIYKSGRVSMREGLCYGQHDATADGCKGSGVVQQRGAVRVVACACSSICCSLHTQPLRHAIGVTVEGGPSCRAAGSACATQAAHGQGTARSQRLTSLHAVSTRSRSAPHVGHVLASGRSVTALSHTPLSTA